MTSISFSKTIYCFSIVFNFWLSYAMWCLFCRRTPFRAKLRCISFDLKRIRHIDNPKDWPLDHGLFRTIEGGLTFWGPTPLCVFLQQFGQRFCSFGESFREPLGVIDHSKEGGQFYDYCWYFLITYCHILSFYHTNSPALHNCKLSSFFFWKRIGVP